MIRRQCLRVVLGALLCMAVAPARAGLFDLSESREQRLGKQIMQQIKSQYAIYQDWRISQIGNLLADASETPRRVAEFWVFPDTKLNAFALPGGYIMITEGLLGKLERDDEIAFVLGHEIGHVIKRHIANLYRRNQETQFGLSVLLTVLGAGSGWWDVGDFLRMVTMNQYSQKHEREADYVGYLLTAKVGWDAEAAVTALEKLRDGSKEPGKYLNKLLGTHPRISEREYRLSGIPVDQNSERPVLVRPPGGDQPADVIRLTPLYLDDKGEPWTDHWAAALKNMVGRQLYRSSRLCVVREWQRNRGDVSRYTLTLQRRLIQVGSKQDATLYGEIHDNDSDQTVWSKEYARRGSRHRVESYADEVGADVREFFKVKIDRELPSADEDEDENGDDRDDRRFSDPFGARGGPHRDPRWERWLRPLPRPRPVGQGSSCE